MLSYNKTWGFHWSNMKKMGKNNYHRTHKGRTYKDFEFQIYRLIFWIFREADGRTNS